MSRDGGPSIEDLRLRTMQIIQGVLLTACVFFAFVGIVVRKRGDMPVPVQPLVSYVGLAFAAMVLPALIIVPRVLAATWRKRIAAGKSPFRTPPRTRTMTFPKSPKFIPIPRPPGGRCIRFDCSSCRHCWRGRSSFSSSLT